MVKKNSLAITRIISKYYYRLLVQEKTFYNNERPHQSMGNRTPEEVYYGLNEKVKRNYLAVGRDLISSSVPITIDMLSQEAVRAAPLGQTQEIIHLQNH